MSESELTFLATGVLIGTTLGFLLAGRLERGKERRRHRNALVQEHDEYEHEAQALLRELGGMEG